MAAKVRQVLNASGDVYGYWFYCPGCKTLQAVHTAGDHPVWSFNGDVEKPTFRPSILSRWARDSNGVHLSVCHAFVTDGQIEFLGDCSHALAGVTLPLEDVEAHE